MVGFANLSTIYSEFGLRDNLSSWQDRMKMGEDIETRTWKDQ